MRHILVASTIVLTLSAVASASTRTLTELLDGSSFTSLALDSDIGDVEISASAAGEISIEVVLTPRRGGLFSSKRQAEREVEAASLAIEPRGATLHVSIDPPADDERRFEEDWTITMPASVALTLDHGVGDISIVGLESAIEADAGVGDAEIEVSAGDVFLDLGVGTAVVRAPAVGIKTVRGASGVGEVELSVLGKRIESGGFISDASTWEGDGHSRIEISVGVGDVVIELE